MCILPLNFYRVLKRERLIPVITSLSLTDGGILDCLMACTTYR